MAKANVERQTQAKLEALDRLRHAERLVTVGKLAAGVAHELGTPMNVILGRAKLISSGEVDGESARSSARIIGEQLEAMTGIIHQLLDFARRKQPKRTQAHGFDLLSQTASLLGALAVKSGVTLKVSEPSAAVEVLGDVPALQQVLNNLVMNAVQATGAGGQVTLGAAQGEAVAPDGRVAHTVQLSVQDTGPGVSEAVREHLFEPFFTTKDVGEGTGLGLAVSWGILQDHDGWISVDSAPGRGATFTVHLPVSAGQGSHEPVAVAVGGR
jgi:signal transduction histidine kinase